MDGRDDEIHFLRAQSNLIEIGKIEEEAPLIDQRDKKEDHLTDC
ncbi:hypothetical protein OROMI_023717 [Orobanche minor]